MNAALTAARAGWRAEVHSLTPTDFQTEIAGFEAHFISANQWFLGGHDQVLGMRLNRFLPLAGQPRHR